MDGNEISQDELVAGLQAGRLDVFRMFVDMHKAVVLNVCYRFVQSREDAEDVAQETFVEVFRSISSLRDPSDLSAWTYRIAVSKSLNLIRWQKRQKRAGSRSAVSINDDAVETLGPTPPDPHELLEQQEQRRILLQALESLPKPQRVAFVLSKYEGMSCQEIADIMETTAPAVISLVHRAKLSLQKKLTRYYRKHL